MTRLGPSSVHILCERFLHGRAKPPREAFLQIFLHPLAPQRFSRLELINQSEAVPELRVSTECASHSDQRQTCSILSGEFSENSEQREIRIEFIELQEMPQALATACIRRL